MKHMNYNAAENQPHKYARPVTLDEMNRMPGQEEYERRTRTSKVFSLGRGLYQAVMYPEAVHFRDKNSGKLEEIDNTLMPIQDSACGVYLTNRNNDELKVEFHGAHDAAMVLLRNEDDCYLGWKLDGGAGRSAEGCGLCASAGEQTRLPPRGAGAAGRGSGV